MEKNIYKLYIENEIIQKTIVFAKAFGLDIIDWDTKGIKEVPTRIYLWSKERAVGFVDYAGSYGFNIVLFSPIGKVEGCLFPKHNCIRYGVNVKGQDNYDRIEGFYFVYPDSNEYSCESKMIIKKDGNPVYNFNCFYQNQYFSLENMLDYEQLAYNQTKAISIWHLKGIENHRMIPVATIVQDKCTFGDRNPGHKGNINCYFASSKEVSGILPNDDPSVEDDINAVNFAQINKEIALYDPRLFEFIAQSREFLTLPELSLYDSMVLTTFYGYQPKVTEGMARIPYQPFSVKENSLVRLLNKQKRK
ncbi:MAG TPA: hypothetical protein PLX66_01965 [Bacilli bacterium]|nr:hypothetical protein [Bacilli bacterium]